MINRLFWQKLVVAFLVAFFGALVPLLTGLGQSPDWKFDKAVWMAALVGAVGAGARAVLALGPVNLVPSDGQHTVIGPREG
jgi:hypothetical protein